MFTTDKVSIFEGINGKFQFSGWMSYDMSKMEFDSIDEAKTYLADKGIELA